jgi:hypothetical protein
MIALEKLWPVPVTVNTNCRSAMGTSQVALVTFIKKIVYSGFFIGEFLFKLEKSHG